MNYLIIIGLLFNSAVVIINRFWKHLPDKVYIPCLIFGICCMIVGAFITKA